MDIIVQVLVIQVVLEITLKMIIINKKDKNLLDYRLEDMALESISVKLHAVCNNFGVGARDFIDSKKI